MAANNQGAYASPGSWADDAACRGRTDEMVLCDAKGRMNPKTRAALVHSKAICAGCPVLDQCRAWCLTSPDPAKGMVAGGMHPKERDQIRRQRRVA